MSGATPGGPGDPDHVVYVCMDPGVPVFGHKGCSVHAQAMLREFLDRGAQVDLVTSRTGGDPPTGLRRVRVHDLGRPTADDPARRERLLVGQDRRAAQLVAAIVGSRAGTRPTLVYQRYSLFSCEVMEGAAALGGPSVLEINAPLVEEQARHRVLVDAAAASARSARAMLAARAPYAVSEPVARWAERLLDGRRRMSVVPNGVDVDRFPVRGGLRDPGSGPLTIAFVGTFRPWHGVDLLVEAAARLGPAAARLLLVGDGPCRAAVLQRASELGLAVEAPGAVDVDRIPALLAGADLAVAAYPAGRHYFSPLKVMEYLAAGLPTVAAAVADLATQLRDGHEILLVPPGDIEALAVAVRRLLDDAALRERLSRAGRLAAEQRLTWRSVADRVLDLAATAPSSPPALAGTGT